MQELFKLIGNYGLKSFNGPLKVPHLGELGQLQPQIANNYFKRIFSEVLPADDYVTYMNQFPTVYLDYADQFHVWKLAGNNLKNIPLLNWEDALGAQPAVVGANGASFFLYFAEDFFNVNDYIAGHFPDDYQIQVKDKEMISPTSWKYRCILDTDDPANHSVPSSALEVGSRWNKDFNFQPMERSSRGTSAHFNTHIEMKSRAALMRMEYKMDGNMIDMGKNVPLVFGFPDPTNPKSTKPEAGAFVNFYDFVAMYQFKKQMAKAFLFSKKNYTQKEIYFNFDDGVGGNGARIEAFSGLFDQIAPTNIHPQSTINLDKIVDMVIENGLAMSMGPNKVIRLETGIYGAIEISKFIESKSTQYTPNFTQDFISANGGSSTFGMPGSYKNPTFSSYKSYNGVQIEVVHRPFFDDVERYKVKHPTESGLVSSRNILVTDYLGQAGIKKLGVKGYESGIYKYIAGMRDPFSPGGMGAGSMSKAPASSSVDQYEVHGMEYIGCVVEDPTKVMYMPFNIG